MQALLRRQPHSTPLTPRSSDLDNFHKSTSTTFYHVVAMPNVTNGDNLTQP
jgi:hypothetical protein